MRDDVSAAEAAQWLAENEDETAMTPERLAAMEAAAAAAEQEAAAGQQDDAAAGQDEAAELDVVVTTPKSTVTLDETVSPVAGRRFTRA